MMRKLLVVMLLILCSVSASAEWRYVWWDTWVPGYYHTYYVTVPYIVNGIANYRYEERQQWVEGYWYRNYRTYWVPDYHTHCR